MTIVPPVGEGDSSHVRIFLRFFLNQVLFLFSYLIPKQKGLVVLGSGHGKRFMGNPKYVYLTMLKDFDISKNSTPDLDFYWITENKQLYHNFINRGWPVLDKFTLRGFWYLLRAEFLVIESGMMSTEVLHDVAYAWLLIGRFKVVQTWHGTAIKRISLDALRYRGVNTIVERLFFWLLVQEFKTYDCVIAQSEYDQQQLPSAFDCDNVPILGSPRNDVFHQKFESIEQPYDRYNLRKFDRIVLYAPTYRETQSKNSGIYQHRVEPFEPFTQEFQGRLDEILFKRNWLMLVKKHHFDHSLSIKPDLRNIVNLSGVDDIQELLIHTDILLTDYSSVYFDFFQSGRPIIHYVYDLENYVTRNRDFYIEFSDAAAGPFAHNEEEVLQYILGVDEWFYDQSYRTHYLSYCRKYHRFNDGCASERLIIYLQHRSNGFGKDEAALKAYEAISH